MEHQLGTEHRELATFPFPPTVRAQLFRAGFRVVEDVVGLTPIQISHGKKRVVLQHKLAYAVRDRLGLKKCR